METNILTPRDLFQKNILYTIPPFQRRYVWNLENQWEPLWEDVRNSAEEYLEQLSLNSNDETKTLEKTKKHFLGAVVVQQVVRPVKFIENREVIDGQQRMTTLQLLLDAIQYVCENKDIKGVKTRLSMLVQNNQDLVVRDYDAFKLWPTASDREAFRHAMHNHLLAEGFKDSLIVQAHNYFQLQTSLWIDDDSDKMQERMEALETAVTCLLEMVVIDLGTQDDPHVIFETLNARGTPLLESDLIKNYVINRTNIKVDDIWGDLDDDWWRLEIKQGRLRRPRIDALLDYWLEMRIHDDVVAGKVFSTFKKQADNHEIDGFMENVKKDLNLYRHYEEKHDDNSTESKFRYRTGVMQMATFTPVLLLMLSWPLTIRVDALKTLESFLVRRMICRKTTKDYNRIALDLVRGLDGCDEHKGANFIYSFLSSQESESRLWPTNQEIEDAFLTLPLYRLLTRGRLRIVLEAVEEYLRNNPKTETSSVERNLTIEHVMPQSWEEHWPLPKNVEEWEGRERRKALLHTIGNLTLITGPLNKGNHSWKKKKRKLNKHSVLFLNRELITQEEWTENTIEIRSRDMAKRVARIWPDPKHRDDSQGDQ